MPHEYNNSPVSGSCCSYNKLSNYNNQQNDSRPIIPPTTSSGYYVVPAWNYRPSYDTLQKGNGCSGYANIISAYGEGADTCSPKYIKKSCQ